MAESHEDFEARLYRLRSDVELAENFALVIGRDRIFPTETGGHPVEGRFYFQIDCWRRDVITGEMGYGYGGKAYLDPAASDDALVKTIFGLYLAYVEHEARETFLWKKRRVFGPHTALDALWNSAAHVDIPSAMHVEDQP